MVFIISCNSEKEYKGEFKRGEIIEKVVSTKDSIQSYAVYLPSNYIEDKSFPIIYCFDPHADGKLAVSKFKEAAEKYGYILIGSNNSKNGLSTLTYTLNTLFDDVKNRISFDEARQYTAGFSGGGRVAIDVSQNYLNIKGVASNSAGVSDKNIPDKKFDFICFFGNEDFNMYEIKSTESVLNSINYDYEIIVFDGKHEWANDTILDDAIIWFEIKAMKNGLKSKNKRFIKEVKQKLELEISNNANDIYLQSLTYLKAINFLDKVADIEDFKEKLEALKQTQEYKNINVKIADIQLKESRLQQSYYEAFKIQDTAWWRREIEVFEKKINETNDDDYIHLYKRTLSFISIISFTMVNNSFIHNDFVNIEKYLKIYEICDSSNNDMLFFYLCFYSLNNDMKKCLEYYNRLKINNYNDFDLFDEEIKLTNFLNSEEYKNISK